MHHISNGFGGTDERAMIEQFHAIHGRNAAERLGYLLQHSYPGVRVTAFSKPKTAQQVFEEKAASEGFSRHCIADFRQIAA